MSGQYAMAEKAFGSLIKLDGENDIKPYDRQDLEALANAHGEQGEYQAAHEAWAKASTL